jgi:hypothetical protein
MQAGTFGEPFRRGRNRRYAALAAVEAHIGQPISPEQLARAAGGGRNRILVIAPAETEPTEDFDAAI